MASFCNPRKLITWVESYQQQVVISRVRILALPINPQLSKFPKVRTLEQLALAGRNGLSKFVLSLTFWVVAIVSGSVF